MKHLLLICFLLCASAFGDQPKDTRFIESSSIGNGNILSLKTEGPSAFVLWSKDGEILAVTGGKAGASGWPIFERETVAVETPFEPHVEKTANGWKITFPKK